MVTGNGAPLKISLVVASTAILAACATPAPPPAPPPPPPPPAKIVIPYRPLPPSGAAYAMNIPRVGQDGIRRTINTGITDDEKVWHFRSGWNVAALNCSQAQYQPVVDAYSSYIRDHARPLRRVNQRLEQAYRDEASSRREGIKAREEQMTMVYNFFALPPVRAQFCRNALDISNRAKLARIEDPIAFAKDNFELLTAPFDEFFARYEAYERSSSDWDARYGSQYGSSQPGYVAVQKAKMSGTYVGPAAYQAAPSSNQLVAPQSVDPTTALAGAAPASETVIDPQTGAEIPVVPVVEGAVSVPVVEPIPDDGEATQAANSPGTSRGAAPEGGAIR